MRTNLQPLPWQTTSVEVHQHIAQRLHVISSALFDTQVSVYTRVTRSTWNMVVHAFAQGCTATQPESMASSIKREKSWTNPKSFRRQKIGQTNACEPWFTVARTGSQFLRFRTDFNYNNGNKGHKRIHRNMDDSNNVSVCPVSDPPNQCRSVADLSQWNAV